MGAGEDAGLLLGEVRALQIGLRRGLLHVGIDGGALLVGHELGHQRVLRGHHHEGRAEERVRTGGEDRELLVQALHRELDHRPLGAADPLALHGLDRLGPVHQLQVVDQPVRVGGDLQHPLLQGPPLAGVVAALGAAVDDLLVGQHGLEGLAPPDGDLGLVGQTLVVQAGEDPLGPAVVLRLAGGQLPVPVVAEADHLQLTAEGLDVGPGGGRGVLAGLDRVLLRRQAEGVVAHGVEHVEALHPLAPRDDVRPDVAHRMPHVEAGPGGVGEHVEAVELRLLGVEAGLSGSRGVEGALGGPVGLPALFDLSGVVGVAHDPVLLGGTGRSFRLLGPDSSAAL